MRNKEFPVNPWRKISAAISTALDIEFYPQDIKIQSGGCINESVVLYGTDELAFFIKLNHADLAEMFAAEAEGLEQLRQAQAIRIPKPICHGMSNPQQAFLAIEYIKLSGRIDATRFGQQLARMHQYTENHFGWYRDNNLGSTPQPNDWYDDWVTFFRKQRLEHQINIAQKQGRATAMVRSVKRLIEHLPEFFRDYTPQPSLLHGDLWSGNWGADQDNNPVIYDPAVYFGDREADLAMMELFGSPGRDFFEAYNDVWPIDSGYAVRRDLYNLYHLINHYNLFGGGYASQAEQVAQRLVDQL